MIVIKAVENNLFVESHIQLTQEQLKTLLEKEYEDRLRGFGKDLQLAVMVVPTANIVVAGMHVPTKELTEEQLHEIVVELEQNSVQVIDFVNNLVDEKDQNQIKPLPNEEELTIPKGAVECIREIYEDNKKVMRFDNNAMINMSMSIIVLDLLLEAFLEKYDK